MGFGLTVISSSASAQSYVGISVTRSSVTLNGDVPPNGVFISRPSSAFRVRGGLEVADGVHLVAYPGVARRNSGGEFRAAGGATAFSDLAITYVTLPLGLRVESSNDRIYVTSLVDFGYLVDASLSTVNVSPFSEEPVPPVEEDVLGNLNPWDVTMELAVGVRVPVGRQTISIEVGWGQSLVNVTKRGFLPVDWSLPQRFKFSGFGLSAGVEFPLGGPREDGDA